MAQDLGTPGGVITHPITPHRVWSPLRLRMAECVRDQKELQGKQRPSRAGPL